MTWSFLVSEALYFLLGPVLISPDENAANPHGGANGSTVLEPVTLILVDVGCVWITSTALVVADNASAHLYGYSSDISRTFFPPFLQKPANGVAPAEIEEKLKACFHCLHCHTPPDWS